MLWTRQKEKVKSKIVILLTDGENNAGQLEPIQAAELAETMGIKIYTIGVGTKGQAPMPVQDPFSGRTLIQWVPVSIDEETLTKVADITHGKYFRATDTDSLEKIYSEIDQSGKDQSGSSQLSWITGNCDSAVHDCRVFRSTDLVDCVCAARGTCVA
jgi:Ca-activated chloride channel family protein